MKVTLEGQMQSGKNRVLITRTGHRYPPKRFQVWRDQMVAIIWASLAPSDFSKIKQQMPVFRKPAPVGLTVHYWPGDQRRRDVPGMLDALCHILERANVLEDDAQIKSVQWEEQPLDRERPRVELVLTVRS